MAAAVLFAGVGVLPLSLAILLSFSTRSGWGVQNFVDALGNRQTWALLGNSVLLGVLTAGFAAALGIPLAVLFAKTDLPLRTPLTVVFSLPLVFPPYILAVGWFEILGRGGVVARWLGDAAGDFTSRQLFGLPGAVLVLGPAFLPIVLLLTMTYLRGVSPALEQAARLSCGWVAVLRRITLPLVTPGIVLSLVLVFLLTMAEFGAPAFLRINVFPVASFTQLSAFYNFGAATAAAMPLVLVAGAGLFLEQRILNGRAWQFRRGGPPDADRIRLGRSARRVSFCVAVLAAILAGAPVAALTWKGLTPGAIADALNRAGASAVRSVLYAGITASLLSVLGFFLAYIVHRCCIPGWRWIDAHGLFLFTLPGTVIGVGVIITWNRPATNWVYATPAILVLGYMAQYLALGTRTILAGFSQITPSMEEAGEMAGAGWIRRIQGILLPLSRPAIVACWTVTFIFCLRDVTLPLLLAPPGRDTLTARTLTLMANGSPELVAALCLLSITLAVLPLCVLAAAWRAWGTAT